MQSVALMSWDMCFIPNPAYGAGRPSVSSRYLQCECSGDEYSGVQQQRLRLPTTLECAIMSQCVVMAPYACGCRRFDLQR